MHKKIIISSVPSIRQTGFLLPVVIALGMGISTISIFALQAIATNSSALSNQHYSVIAQEAAHAGLARCNHLVSQSTTLTATTCSGGTASDSPVMNDMANGIVSRYSLGDLVATSPTGSYIVTSTGVVTIDGVTVATEKVQSFVQTGIPGSTGGPTTKHILSVSTGVETTCVVGADTTTDTSGKAFCWGSNSYGMLGNDWNYGASGRSRVAVPVIQGTMAQTSSSSNTCDTNSWNLIPDCTGNRTSAIPENHRVTKVSVGTNHVCAVATDPNGYNGRAYCWGRNNYGQLGNKSSSNSSIPVAVNVDDLIPAQVSVPGNTCGVAFRPACAPAQPASALYQKNVVDISAGKDFTCATTSDGRAACWGRNHYGQLGNDTRNDSNYPVAVSSSTTPLQECVRWARNVWGTLVCNQNVNRPASPTIGKQLTALANVKNVWTMCAIDTTGAAYCWGQNFAGQLGSGTMLAGSHTGSDSHRSSNENACASNRRTVANNIVNSFPVYDDSSARPARVDSSQRFQEITIIGNDTSVDPLSMVDTGSGQSRTDIDETTIYSYATALTRADSPSPNAIFSWGGTVRFSGWIDCYRNGDTYGSGWSRGDAELTRSYEGSSSPSFRMSGVATSSGNSVNGLFCMKQTMLNTISCRRGNDAVLNGQLGNGYSCTVTILNRCNNQPNGIVGVHTTSDDSNSQLPPTANIIALDTGILNDGSGNYTCAIGQQALRNYVHCWGTNNMGQLGEGSTTNQSRPRTASYGTESALYTPSSSTTGTPPVAIIRGY